MKKFNKSLLVLVFCCYGCLNVAKSLGPKPDKHYKMKDMVIEPCEAFNDKNGNIVAACKVKFDVDYCQTPKQCNPAIADVYAAEPISEDLIDLNFATVKTLGGAAKRELATYYIYISSETIKKYQGNFDLVLDGGGGKGILTKIGSINFDVPKINNESIAVSDQLKKQEQAEQEQIDKEAETQRIEDKKKAQEHAEQLERIADDEITNQKCNSEIHSGMEKTLSWYKTIMGSLNFDFSDYDIEVTTDKGLTFPFSPALSGTYEISAVSLQAIKIDVLDPKNNSVSSNAKYSYLLEGQGLKQDGRALIVGMNSLGKKYNIKTYGKGCSMILIFHSYQ